MKTSDLLMVRPIKCPTSRKACSVYPTWIVWWSPAGGAWASGLAWEAVPCYLFTPCFAHEVAQSSLELSYSVTSWTRDIILWSRHGESQTHLDVYIQPDNWQHIHKTFSLPLFIQEGQMAWCACGGQRTTYRVSVPVLPCGTQASNSGLGASAFTTETPHQP